MSLRAFRAEGSPGSGLAVELYTSADGPVILYGHDGMTPEQEQRLEHWMRQATPQESVAVFPSGPFVLRAGQTVGLLRSNDGTESP